MDRDGVDGRVDAEDVGLAGGRPDEVQQRPDRRRLARAVRPEEPEDLARLDLEVDLDDPPGRAI